MKLAYEAMEVKEMLEEKFREQRTQRNNDAWNIRRTPFAII